MPTDDLTALRNTIAAEILSAKQDFPNHHAELDRIGKTLDLIGGHMVPDFISLDASTNGAITALLREDMRSIAEHGIMSSEITDARAFIRALVIFVDAIRTDEVEWIARRVRRTLDGKPPYDA